MWGPTEGGGGCATAAPFIPPAPIPPPHDLRLIPLIRSLRTNVLAPWPARAFSEPWLHRRYLGTDCYLISDPAIAEQVLAAPLGTYERPLGFRRLLSPVVGRGLLLAEGDRWRAQRKMIAPAFNCRAVESVLPRLAEVGHNAVARLGGSSRADLWDAFQHAAMDAIGSAVFGLPFESFAGRISHIRDLYFSRAARVSILDFLARNENDFLLSIGLRGRLGRQADTLINEIVERRRDREAQPGPATDIIGLLLAAGAESGERLSWEDIRDQIATMIATGFDSTAQLLFWTTYLLAQDQREQTAIRAEVTAFPPEAVRSLADLKQWPRLQCALMEALRLYPPIIALFRVPQMPVELGGVTVRSGSIVTISPWVMHRHHGLWEEPGAFQPARFTGHALSHPRPGYLPFGGGSRICIGGGFALAEASLILAPLFARYTVTLEDDRPVMPVCIVTTSPDRAPTFRLRAAGGRA